MQLVMKHCIDERAMHFDRAIVADETKSSELVHEMTDSGPRRADHFGQSLLAEVDVDRLRIGVLAEVCEQQQQSRQSLLARVEELIDQVLFHATVASQQVGDEKF